MQQQILYDRGQHINMCRNSVLRDSLT